MMVGTMWTKQKSREEGTVGVGEGVCYAHHMLIITVNDGFR